MTADQHEYGNQYVEIQDTIVRKAVEAVLNPELLKTRSVGSLVYMPDEKQWLVRLYYDFSKAMK